MFIIFVISFYSVNIFIKNLDNKDPKEVVIDEFIGQSIPICLYEIAHEGTKETNHVLTFYFIMFILFRIFDIVKPYPVSYYDKNFKNIVFEKKIVAETLNKIILSLINKNAHTISILSRNEKTANKIISDYSQYKQNTVLQLFQKKCNYNTKRNLELNKQNS